ncbi:hypothetical protein [Azospirillum argentinense]
MHGPVPCHTRRPVGTAPRRCRPSPSLVVVVRALTRNATPAGCNHTHRFNSYCHSIEQCRRDSTVFFTRSDPRKGQ